MNNLKYHIIFLCIILKLHFVYSFQSQKYRSEVKPLIINGEPASIEEFPYLVFYMNNGSCGGNIINTYTILTAAHCVEGNLDVTKMSVAVGITYVNEIHIPKNIFFVNKAVMHPSYQRRSLVNDIALVFLNNPLIFGRGVQKAALIDYEWFNDYRFNIETNFTLAGWGRITIDTHATRLMKTEKKWVRNKKCQKMIPSSKITKEMLCFYSYGKSSACTGDSGGAIVWERKIVGITSFIQGKKNQPSCAVALDSPTVYTNVYYYRSWINNEISKYHQLNNKKRFLGKSS